MSMTTIHINALQYKWYFFFVELDIIVHGLGTIALIIPLIIYIRNKNIILPIIFTVPILWEVFQYFFINTSKTGFVYATDTIIDIAVGTVVGLTLFFFYPRTYLT